MASLLCTDSANTRCTYSRFSSCVCDATYDTVRLMVAMALGPLSSSSAANLPTHASS